MASHRDEAFVPDLVSIMIPTYERPGLFKKTLESALAQTYPQVEIIVCDNSRNEATAEIMREYVKDPRVRYVRNREATSKEENFASFEKLAKGEYLQWLMDDDILHPEKLRRMVDCFRRDPGVVLVTSRRGAVDEEGNLLRQLSTELEIPGEYRVFPGGELGRRMLRDMRNYVGEPSAALFRRRDLRHHYWHAEAKGYRRISDVAMWLELMEKGDCAVFRDSLSYYRCHGEQEGRQKDVILQSRVEWFRLGSAYYHDGRFLEKWEDYECLLGILRDEYLRTKPWTDPEFLACPSWESYKKCMDEIRELLLRGEAVSSEEGFGKKVIVISMVKNEADVIESFVRHSLTFADGMLIADHCSGDRTGEILEKLREEGLPISVRLVRRIELAHAEVMNDLLQQALREFRPDVVLPLDADEFLVNTDTGESCRSVLERLQPEKLYKLNWRLYEPLSPKDETRFLLSRPSRRSRDFAPGQKMAVGGRIAARQGFYMNQGCHYACWGKNGEKVPWEDVPAVHVAHYHWRSDEQYAAKIATSWPNNVAKYSLYTPTTSYLKGCYEKLGRGEVVTPGSAIQDPETFDLRPYCREIPLRYSDRVHPDPLRNLMGASVLLAEAYLEEKILKREKWVTVVIPYLGEDEESCRGVELALSQNYPYKEIFLCGIAASAEEVEWPEHFQEQVGLLDDLPGKDVFARLSQEARGDYVQWILPGYSMPEDKIMKMVACMESQDLSYGILFADGRGEFAPWEPWVDFRVDPVMATASPKPFWRTMLRTGKYPSGGMNGALFRRSLMEGCRWLRHAFFDERPLPYVMWIQALRQLARTGEGDVGILGDPFCERLEDSFPAEELLWHALEWFALLKEYGSELPTEDYGSAVRNFCSLGADFEKLRATAEPGLWCQYEKALAAMEKEMER